MNESDSDESERKHPDYTDVDESGSDESEREHPDDTDAEETDLGETEREEPDDTDVNESNSGEKDENHHITIIPRNDPQNPYKIRPLTSYYLRSTRRNRPY